MNDNFLSLADTWCACVVCMCVTFYHIHIQNSRTHSACSEESVRLQVNEKKCAQHELIWNGVDSSSHVMHAKINRERRWVGCQLLLASEYSCITVVLQLKEYITNWNAIYYTLDINSLSSTQFFTSHSSCITQLHTRFISQLKIVEPSSDIHFNHIHDTHIASHHILCQSLPLLAFVSPNSGWPSLSLSHFRSYTVSLTTTIHSSSSWYDVS